MQRNLVAGVAAAILRGAGLFVAAPNPVVIKPIPATVQSNKGGPEDLLIERITR